MIKYIEDKSDHFYVQFHNGQFWILYKNTEINSMYDALLHMKNYIDIKFDLVGAL